MKLLHVIGAVLLFGGVHSIECCTSLVPCVAIGALGAVMMLVTMRKTGWYDL